MCLSLKPQGLSQFLIPAEIVSFFVTVFYAEKHDTLLRDYPVVKHIAQYFPNLSNGCISKATIYR